MQALEKIGVLEQDEDKGGRRITQSGRRDLDREFFFFLAFFFCGIGLRGWDEWIQRGGVWCEWRRVFADEVLV